MYKNKALFFKTFQGQGISRVPYRSTTNENVPEPGASKYLSSTRRKLLEDILRKEATAEKRSKLHAVLTQKLIKKHGREYSKVINSVVMVFLDQHAQINADELKTLERTVDEAISAYNQSRDNRNNNKQSLSQTVAEPATVTPRLPSPPKGKEWQVIQAYQALVAEEERKKEIEQMKNKKLMFKKALDDHVHLRRQLNSNNKADDINYNQHVQQDVVKYRREEEEKAEVIKNKHLEERRIREAQILDRQRRKNEENDIMKRQEDESYRLAQQQLAQEKKQQQDAKIAERQRQEMIATENLENLKKRALRKQEEAAEDYRLMQEYAAKLDREARERDTAFQRRLATLEVFATKYHHEGAGKKEREDGLKFEATLLKEIQHKLEMDKLDEKKRQESKKMKELQAAKENAKLLESKRHEIEINRRNDEILAKKYQEDAADYQRQMQMDKQKQLEKQLQYRHVLDDHVRLRKEEDINLVGMADKERRMNLSDLRKIQNDKDMYLKVLKKIGVNA